MSVRNPYPEWRNTIKSYCEANGLSFEKADKMVKSFNKEWMALQYFSPEPIENVTMGGEPMPVVLMMFFTDTGLTFQQTEHTKKYLAQ